MDTLQFIPTTSLSPPKRSASHRRHATPKCHTDSKAPPSISRRSTLKLLALTLTASTIPSSTNAKIQLADPEAGSQIFTTPSGIRYYDFITPSQEAKQVVNGTRVTVHYTLGTTGARNGWKIDSSFDRDPLSFTVGAGQVVRGLDEGVLGMRMGGKRRVIIPSELGYKTKDDRPVVMGFAEWQRFKNIYLNKDRVYKPDLVMDVTLIKVS